MNSLFAAICLIFSILIVSCEKVIDIDLKTAPNKVVVEGIINDQPGPYYVKLTKTVGFSQPNNSLPLISGAIVIIRDNTGIVDTLSETQPGIYATSKILGVSGRTYEMNINIQGEMFFAVSSMPFPSSYDSLGLTKIPFGGAEQFFATPFFRDGPIQGDNYRFITKINGKQDKINTAWNDVIGNGITSNQPIFTDTELKKGDTLEVEMQCIDINVYNYFFTLSSIDQGVTPSNPPTNIKGDCLGYFSAHTSRKRTTIVP